MRRIVVGIVVTLVLFVFTSPPGSAARENRAGIVHAQARPPTVLYIASGHLWLRPVDGGTARLISTPWPTTTKGGSQFSGFKWSPDGQRVALDDARGRLAVMDVITGRVTVLLSRRCSGNCSAPTYSWSPNGRYLALVQPMGNGEKAILRIWDSHAGTLRQLLTGLAGYVAYPQWSHDSRRIATEIGPFDVIKSIFPKALAVDLAGHVVHLGKGQYITWSPDDRLVGIIRPNICGANTCDEDEIVRSSTGGPAIVLARHSTNPFDNPIWAPQTGGYAFDGWLLNASGHPTRHLVGPHERALSWRQDGSLLALQTYHPYEGAPDALYLSTPTGKRTHVYTDTRNSGCGACSKDVYRISWGRGDRFAFVTPTYPTPKNVTVYPKSFLSPTGGGSLVSVGIPGTDVVDILGLVEGDETLVLHAGKAIYRYGVSTHRLATVVTGVPAWYDTAVLDPTLLPTGQSGLQSRFH